MRRNYSECVFYQIDLTSRYLKYLGTQFFNDLKGEVSFEEFATLNVLEVEGEICQRDLARAILKDRANTGKLVNTLEKKRLVDRKLEVKKNRAVKLVTLSKNGKQILEEMTKKIEPTIDKLELLITEEDEKKITDALKDFRKKVNEVIKIKI